MKNKKIAFVGSMIVDLVKTIDVWPDKGMLVTISDTERAVGGLVCNTAVDIKAMDESLEVKAYGKVGEDGYGDWALSFLKGKGIDVSAVKRSPNKGTSYTDVMTLDGSGERTFFHYRGANAEFTIDDVDIESLDCDLLHLGYLLALDGIDAWDEEYGTKSARFLHDVQKKGIKTCIDVVSDQNGKFAEKVAPVIKYCDYIVINEIEGGMLCGISPRNESGDLLLDNLKKICQELKSQGVKDTVVLHCPELSCAIDSNEEFHVSNSFDLPKDYVVGTVGAGDAFCAGMLYSFLNGYDVQKGMQLASCSAVCNLSAKNSVDGARSLAEILKVENMFSRRK